MTTLKHAWTNKPQDKKLRDGLSLGKTWPGDKGCIIVIGYRYFK